MGNKIKLLFPALLGVIFLVSCKGSGGQASSSTNATVLAAQNGSISRAITVTIPASVQGTLTFQQPGITPRNTLTLLPGSKGTITLANTGLGDISNLNVSIQPSLVGFTSPCSGTLAAGNSCTINYTIASPVTQLIAGAISATGTNASQSPQILSITIPSSSLGKFDWQYKDVSTLTADVLAGRSGTLTLANTGGQDITGMKIVSSSTNVTLVSAAGDCSSLSTLPFGTSCQQGFAISGAIPAGTTATAVINASGNSADETPLPFTLNIGNPGVGKLSFSQSPLELASGQIGQIVLTNTGDAAIAGLKVSSSPSTLFSSFSLSPSCTANSFGPKDSCTISYTAAGLSDVKTVLQGTIAATVTDNTAAVSVPVTVSAQGHFSFRYSDNSKVTQLDLTPPKLRRLFIWNTGNQTITNIKLAITPQTIVGYFTGGCTSITQLAPNSFCDLTYNIPANAQQFSGNISITGTGSDN